jgi:hypothetical protein
MTSQLARVTVDPADRDDGDGVALAAIQALNDLILEKDTQLESQAALIKNLELRLQSIEESLNAKGR